MIKLKRNRTISGYLDTSKSLESSQSISKKENEVNEFFHFNSPKKKTSRFKTEDKIESPKGGSSLKVNEKEFRLEILSGSKIEEEVDTAPKTIVDNNVNNEKLNEKEIFIEIKEETKENQSDNDTDKTVEIENFDGNEFLQIVDDCYKKSHSIKRKLYHSSESSKIFDTINDLSSRDKKQISNTSLNRVLTRGNMNVIEPVIEDPKEDDGDLTKTSIKKKV